MPLGVAAIAEIAIGAAAVGVGAYNAYQSTKTQNTAMGMAQTIFGEQQYYEQQLQQLIADPSSVTKLPNYQFQLDQGEQSVERQMGSSGFFGSGNSAAALMQYGQGFAGSAYQQQAQLLAQLAGLAPSSATGATNAATNAGGLSSANWNNMLAQAGIMGSVMSNPYGGGGGNNTASMNAFFGSSGPTSTDIYGSGIPAGGAGYDW